MDQYYTPSNVAMHMVEEASSAHEKGVIVDFAAGDGELLRAAEAVWPKASFYAMDIDRDAVGKLARRHPNWHVGRADFMNSKSRNSSSIVRGLAQNASLILLNPPFSCRGGRYQKIDFYESIIKCSPALAFVFISLNYLSVDGELIVILPRGVLYGEKDEIAWKALCRRCIVRVKAQNGPNTFPGCFPKTTIVHLSMRPRLIESRIPAKAIKKMRNTIRPVTLQRGTRQVNSKNVSSSGRVPFIHTTDLKCGNIFPSDRFTNFDNISSLSGPAVLFPRVGKPDKNKVCLYEKKQIIVISDCIFALRCNSNANARRTQRIIRSKWSQVKMSYSGTCAPYTTIQKIMVVLNKIDIPVIR